ncbi:bifunctional heptose 7-phosphate kinase/heptose 1-phosphate adenyltransferase [Emticicia sp. BO119]|uniref:bifunctional heptose 7-phosphate kinase/heptose 1-phosphate adenyltransferase n=1 Tax=Emticicia sp. BO119 TaxID=2757768 RepID=UPI0015EFF2DC|nr:PfkB family carbohydrate kinase [Emticicia sp. BO119]MBA4853556.1 carbohydrate kinase [Emticicia sp. BO119]
MPIIKSEIEAIFKRISSLRVGVIGDFAVDFYYDINYNTNEYSVETNKEVFWASKPHSSLGAAGNVVNNLSTLGIKNIQVFGCIGNDIYGREMQNLFHDIKVDTKFLKVLSSDWDTCTYTKPMAKDGESNRLDFGTNNRLADELFNELLGTLATSLHNLDVLVINQQFPNPLLNPKRIEQLNLLIAQFSACLFVSDLRTYGSYIKNTILKVNTEEMARLLNVKEIDEADHEACVVHGKTLQTQIGDCLIVTRGEHGILYLDKEETQNVRAVSIKNEIDTVGAGDTVVAAFSASRGAGASIQESLEIANLAAAVTVQKLQQTGTATLEEIITVYQANSIQNI